MTRTSTLHVLVAADAHELALLEDAEQLHLGGEIGLADLVQEQRAPVGRSRTSRALRACAPVNEPFSWPNSSDLDQVRRDRGAVDPEEREIAARRVEVDRARDQLLAHAALAEDEHASPAAARRAGSGRARRASPGSG